MIRLLTPSTIAPTTRETRVGEVANSTPPIVDSATASTLPAESRQNIQDCDSTRMPDHAPATRGRLRALLDRFADWCRRISGEVEFEICNLCPVCEDICMNVFEGAPACEGRPWVADCTICLRTVELTRHDEHGACEFDRRHLLANRRPKPLMTLVKESPMPR